MTWTESTTPIFGVRLTPEMRMPYTVWSRGRLVGESELAYARSLPGLRAGDFEPSPLGEKLMPIIIGVGPALCALHEAAEDVLRTEKRKGRRARNGDWPASVKKTTEYADAMSLPDELESLALELRDPGGAVVKTEWIAVQDTHRLVALAREDLQSEYPDMTFEDDDPEPWEPQPPRYQILVALDGHDRSMARLAKRKRH